MSQSFSTMLGGASVEGGLGGTAPATLSLALGAPASFGGFTPGVDRNYDERSVRQRSWPPGQRVVRSGRAAAGQGNTGAFAPLSTSGSPLALLTYTGPVSNDVVSIGFRQHIAANRRCGRAPTARRSRYAVNDHAVTHS